MKNNAVRKRTGLSFKLNIALIVTFVLLFAWSIVLVKDKLLSNANEMGTYLAESYAAEEESLFASYETLLATGSHYANAAIENGEGSDAVQRWLASYDDYLADIMGSDVLDPYAVVDGEIVAARPWEGDAGYDYASTDWYRNALDAPAGEVAFTNAYQDAITGKYLFTLSTRLAGDGNVMAFDVTLDNLGDYVNSATMPEDSSYFLFDASGWLLDSDTRLDLEADESKAYLESLLERIEDGSLEGHDSYITDIYGVNRGVYYTHLDNGWVSVITIPLNNILQDGWDLTIATLVAMSLLLVALLVFVTIREYLRGRAIEHTAETLRILGDTFYAIYRIDLAAGTYETVKSSEDMRSTLGGSGSYDHLIQSVVQVVEEKTYAVFEDSFSLDNIRRLSVEGVGEFGGDYQRRFGSVYKWVSIAVTFSDDLGRDEAIMSFREIDAEKRRQMQQLALLESSLSSARQAAERKNEFFSKVSHDLRTPLNAIIGLADLALKDPDDGKRVRDLERIKSSGEQMLTLVNDVLDMSRIEHGSGSMLDVAPMDLAACLRDSVAMFETQAEREGKALSVEVDVEDAYVYGDSFRLTQVMNNLISNAVKYTSAGDSIEVSLKEVSTSAKVDKYQFVVRDTGVGMSEEFLDHVFEPFARETMFSTRRIAGTGLGMPIVKSLVQQMSGEIAVESQLGVGSAFIVTLPFEPAERTEQQAQDESAFEPPDLTGLTVIVAEDNEINSEIACAYLDMMGARSVTAWNGREAVEAFSSMEIGAVAAVLMDMQMPEMDGCEACEAIRAMDRPDAKDVPVIAVTANAFAEDITRTTKAGMNAHVSKPLDFESLAQALRAVLGK